MNVVSFSHLAHAIRSPSLNMDASQIGQKIPKNYGRICHNHDGPTYNVTFHGVAPHSLILGANGNSSEQSVLEHITPQPPKALRWDLEHTTLQPPIGSERDLCCVHSVRKPDGTRSFSFHINHPEILRSVTGLLDYTNHVRLWQVAHALRSRRREYLKNGQFVREVDLILRDLEETMRSQLQDSIEQNHSDVEEYKLSLFYSIIMLSHGASATLSQVAFSHSLRLDQVLLLSSGEVTLVFAHTEQAKSYREVKVLDLPKLHEQGIDIDFEPFLKQMLEGGKYEQGAQRVAHQRREDPKSGPQEHATYSGSAEKRRSGCHDNCLEVGSNPTSFIGCDDEGQEREETIEDVDSVGNSFDSTPLLERP